MTDRPKDCRRCNGTGLDRPGSTKRCPQCNGSGEKQRYTLPREVE